jgi:hypothetical protein
MSDSSVTNFLTKINPKIGNYLSTDEINSISNDVSDIKTNFRDIGSNVKQLVLHPNSDHNIVKNIGKKLEIIGSDITDIFSNALINPTNRGLQSSPIQSITAAVVTGVISTVTISPVVTNTLLLLAVLEPAASLTVSEAE